jgi:hypothetical protein
MSLVHLLLLILGVVLVIVGAIRLAKWHAWVDGLICVIVGLLLLGFSGAISA